MTFGSKLNHLLEHIKHLVKIVK